MKLKKKVKRMIAIVIVLLVLVAAGVGALIIFKNPEKPKVSEVKIVNEVDKYDYKLKENKTSTYKKMFDELKKILKEEPVDEEAYAKKVAEMFVYDFYSLEDKAAKTDIGGVDFVYPGVLENFLQNAQDTYYKYVESNIYNDRKQELPVVDEITINDIKTEEFAYEKTSDPKAYKVNVSWTYTKSNYDDYQNEATLIFIHDGKNLSLVELK